MVPSPLSRTVAPLRRAAERTHSSRWAATSSAGRPSRRPSSPSCGVSTVGIVRSASSSGLSPSAYKASASSSNGRSRASSSRTNSCASSARPRPGPTATAFSRAASSNSALRAASVNRPSAPGASTVMTSGYGLSPPAPSGRAACTSPAPERSAAMAVMCAAPLMPREPPTTSTVPTERLWSSAPLGTSSGSRPSSVSSHTSASWSQSGGMPMGTTTTSPLHVPPGVTKWPILAACNATVRSATTAGPSTAPVLAPTPLAMSMLTTAPGASLLGSMATAAPPLAAPVKPVPKIASNTTSASSTKVTTPSTGAPPASNASRTSTPSLPRMPRLSSASPPYSPAGASVNTVTSTPASNSSRATTKPSPPLLPLPANTTASSGSYRSRISPATAMPARSMRCPPGMPTPWMAVTSICRITSAVYRPISRDSYIGVLLQRGGHGVGHAAGMAQRDFDARHAQATGDACHVSVQRYQWLPPRQYLDVAPHEPDDTDSQRLAHRLLGGEARGVVGEAVGEAVAVGALLGAEQARVGPGQTLQQALDARRFGDVDAEAEEQAAGRDVRERGRRSTPPSPSWRGCAAGPR